MRTRRPVGCRAAALLGPLTANVLFGVTPSDPASFAMAMGVVTLAALVATYVPARRAVRVDPNIALRAE